MFGLVFVISVSQRRMRCCLYVVNIDIVTNDIDVAWWRSSTSALIQASAPIFVLKMQLCHLNTKVTYRSMQCNRKSALDSILTL